MACIHFVLVCYQLLFDVEMFELSLFQTRPDSSALLFVCVQFDKWGSLFSWLFIPTGRPLVRSKSPATSVTGLHSGFREGNSSPSHDALLPSGLLICCNRFHRGEVGRISMFCLGQVSWTLCNETTIHRLNSVKLDVTLHTLCCAGKVWDINKMLLP